MASAVAETGLHLAALWPDTIFPIPDFETTDPTLEAAIAKGEGWYVDFFRTFDRLFTFGATSREAYEQHLELIGRARARVPRRPAADPPELPIPRRSRCWSSTTRRDLDTKRVRQRSRFCKRPPPLTISIWT